MPYPIFTIANTLLEKSVSEDSPLTHMKLQKMAYCLHGWHLAEEDEPACSQPVEAWKYGPVWGDLYHMLKRHGHAPIGERDIIYERDENGVLVFYTVPKTNTRFHEILGSVWRKYAQFDALKLSQMTHKPGTPWDKARRLGAPFIDNDEIKKHFREEVVGGIPGA